MKAQEIPAYRYKWSAFERDVKKLCKRIDFSNYDILCGIAVGGLPLLTKLVNKTKKSYIIVMCRSYEDRVQKDLFIHLNFSPSLTLSGKRILAVDDVADSGKTLKGVTKELMDRGAASVETLTLFYKLQSVIVPEWYVHEVENHQWINFPWE